MTTTTITIHGMTCDGCVRALTTALNAAPAVDKATVTLSPAQAIISYDSAHTTPEQLCKLVTDAGFEGTPAQRP